MNKRLQIMLNWAAGKRNNVSFLEIVRYLTKPSHFKAGKSKIREILENGDYLVVYFEGIAQPLYWPKEYGGRCLHGVAGELLNNDHWHFYEINETKVSEGDVVLDCGASEGLFSLSVAGRCKKVYAIEPLPCFIRCMGKTFSNFDNVEILPFALSNEPGEASIVDHGLTSVLEISSDKTMTKVQLNTIDNLFYLKGIPVNYIKADLEGFEIKMLEGARKSIAAHKPKIAITTYHDPRHANLITEFLKDVTNEYKFKAKGIEQRSGSPIMIHAWV